MLELGELYESLGRESDAAEQYARLRAALAHDDGQGVDNALLRGRFEADHGDPAAAVEVLDAAWGRAHRSAAVADALGWALHRSGDPSAALEYAARAVDTGGHNASYAYHLGVIQKALGSTVRRAGIWWRPCAPTRGSRPWPVRPPRRPWTS